MSSLIYLKGFSVHNEKDEQDVVEYKNTELKHTLLKKKDDHVLESI